MELCNCEHLWTVLYYVYYRTVDPIAMPKELGDVTGQAARANGPGDEPTAAGCPMRGNSGRMAFQTLRHFFSDTISASVVTGLLCPFLRYIDTVKKNQEDRRICRFWFRNEIFEYQIKPFWTELPCVHWNLSQSAYLLYLVFKQWHFSCIYKIKLTRLDNKNLMQKWWTKVYGSIARVADRLLARPCVSNPSRGLWMRSLSVLTYLYLLCVCIDFIEFHNERFLSGNQPRCVLQWNIWPHIAVDRGQGHFAKAQCDTCCSWQLWLRTPLEERKAAGTSGTAADFKLIKSQALEMKQRNSRNKTTGKQTLMRPKHLNTRSSMHQSEVYQKGRTKQCGSRDLSRDSTDSGKTCASQVGPLSRLSPNSWERSLVWPACDPKAHPFSAKFFALFWVHTGVLFFGAGHLDLQLKKSKDHCHAAGSILISIRFKFILMIYSCKQ